MHFFRLNECRHWSHARGQLDDEVRRYEEVAKVSKEAQKRFLCVASATFHGLQTAKVLEVNK